MRPLRIGQLANRAGVGVETIRFYERKGLIEQPPRRSEGYRQYPYETVRRVRFIRRAKELGFTLREISELLSLRGSPESTCADVKTQAMEKLEDIEERIVTLEKMRMVLADLVSSCSGSGPTEECPILAVLDNEADHDSTN